MLEDSCTCCGIPENRDDRTATTATQWSTETPVLEAQLPEELQAALGRFLGTEPVETLGDWTTAVRRLAGDGSITLEELCLSEEPTDHWALVDGERYDFACFYDAVILAGLTDRPVDIRTKSPGGTVIEARAIGTSELTVAPREAVFSFGIDASVEPPSDGEPSLEQGYAAICPYVKAFPDRTAYERWATTVPAATVAMPLSGATEFATQLVR
ncbi:alkylmercury lyase [Natronococcus pandeyae]|uniref:Alkylmercury lyase n=1 Tax=Natronococcus pandeyae TaxID=2055836 RepID=A0A8J8Q5C7_9EURY|nr:organomercurial lyase [Natronococcus pandeyae]TYL37904.1 alkylmercury lyase [Natronococcus pandeyae]